MCPLCNLHWNGLPHTVFVYVYSGGSETWYGFLLYANVFFSILFTYNFLKLKHRLYNRIISLEILHFNKNLNKLILYVI